MGLDFDKEKNYMTCKIFLQAKETNAFTVGTSNFRTSTPSRHVDSSGHKEAVLKVNTEDSITKAIKSAVQEKEKGMDVALKTTYWLAKEGISTRKYSSLLSLLEFLECPSVNELNCGANANYHSDVIANELQNAIAQVIREDIDNEITQSICFSLLVDESTDISVTQMLVMYIRHVNPVNFKPVTHFLNNVQVKDGKAATLTEAILDTMRKRNIPMSKLTGFGSDGASAVASTKEGVAGKLKRMQPNIVTLHCIAHKL